MGEATLRQWEARYGFPQPHRSDSGHRRYREEHVEAVRRVVEAKESGLSLKAAIDRVTRVEQQPRKSVFATVREMQGNGVVHALPKRALISLSRAIEDETLRNGAGVLLLGGFQHEGHYRASQRRWTQLGRAAEVSVVFADFPEPSLHPDQPAEIPIVRRGALEREWVVVALAADRWACLVGWERPAQDDVPDMERTFEVVWSVDRQAVVEATRASLELAQVPDDLRTEVTERVTETPTVGTPEELQHATALTNRMISYLVGA